MNHEIYGWIPYYGQAPFYCPYCRQDLIYCPYYSPEVYWCPYLNQANITRMPIDPNTPIKKINPNVPIKSIIKYAPQMPTPEQRAKDRIDSKWNTLNGEPGAAVSGVEKVGTGYRIRYQNGAIYTKAPGKAYWVHGAIGDRYNALGAVGSWLGFPITDELPIKYDNGRISSFENGDIYFWPDTGAIDIGEILLTYKGINCFGTTSGPGTDEVYAVIGVVAPTGNEGNPVDVSTSLTRLYKGVDGGDSVPDYIELYRGKPYGFNISFLLMEHDQGDPNKYYNAVKKGTEKGAEVLASYLTGPVAIVAGPVLEAAVPAITDEINSLLGTGDDTIGNVTIPLSAKEVIVMAARNTEYNEKQIKYKLATPLLTGDGASYKGYFSLSRSE